MDKQVNSKKRVLQYGEVFTGQREVNAMLDLVKDATKNIDSRFLEQACGEGNFLMTILERKLSVIESRYYRSRYYKSQPEYEKYLVIAASSIYGIDILKDNVTNCRKRLFQMINEKYTSLFKDKAKSECKRAIQYILSRNIIHGDALTLKTVGKNPRPITFSEWSFHGNMVKRRDFTFSSLLPDEQNLVSDLGEKVFIPTETRSYPRVQFLKVGKA